ncbi:autotransporter assembly complex protein TamA [Paraglaciecola aquimarina]|uniref:Translocation and assembly module subunit TamA n=1 Tax=Paraglaciecola algarum TaxID=3050085 RepID=A0ABS9DAF4_9ALTE|nr:autotransporter assembly complex family protein [Paraglaciecola sp. G1-23]MCF2949810.1 autotransporter assembly complex protein TamA [Paraglaciecola sp. G1-23]
MAFLLLPAFYASSANVDIEGIEHAQVLQNIQVLIEALSEPTDRADIETYQSSLLNKAKLGAQVFGYYHLQAHITPPSDPNLTGDWLMEVDLGEVTKIRSLSIKMTGQGLQDRQLQNLLSSLPLKQGQAFEHQAYESSKARLQSLALSRGYFDFEYDEASIKVYESQYAADITLHISSGQRYKFGELQFGKDLRAQSLTQKLAPFKAGDLYQANQLGLFNQLIKQTQYFRQVIVRPLVEEAEDYQVPIQVILTHKPRDNFDVGVGYSSNEGPRVTAKWRRPWVNSHGHSVGGEVFVSAPEQYASFDYRVPLEDPIQNYASFQLGYQAKNNNDTQSDTLSISATRHWVLKDSDWHRSAFVKLEQETFVQGFEPEQTTRLVMPGATISRVRSKGGLDVYWGDKQSITTEFASDSVLSDINLFRVTAQSKWLRSVDKHRFLMGFQVGGISTSNFEQVPSSLRYFAGGDQSVRGFGYERLSPFELDEQGNPLLDEDGKRRLTGGQYLAVASVEYSYPVADKWRAAVFVDAGNASENLAEDIATGVGIGAIWTSPVGPIRLYLAKGKSDLDSNVRLHFSMGPAL